MRRALGSEGDLQRIENIARNGMPDVNGCIRGREFWVELKWLERWPASDSTVVAFPKYRKEQRIWMRRRCQDHGARNVFMLVQVDTPRTFVLFDWKAAVYNVGFMPRPQLLEQALLVFEGAFPSSLIVSLLRREGVNGS